MMIKKTMIKIKENEFRKGLHLSYLQPGQQSSEDFL